VAKEICSRYLEELSTNALSAQEKGVCLCTFGSASYGHVTNPDELELTVHGEVDAL
jgi:hypothetical protein